MLTLRVKKTCGYLVVLMLLLASGCKPPPKALAKGFHEGCRFYPVFASEELEPDPGYQKLYDFMHSRPFWIRDSDTLGIFHPEDMEIHDYFKVSSFIVPGAIVGNCDTGGIGYLVDYVPPDEFMPDGGIGVSWFLLPLDADSSPVKHTPGEWFRFSQDAKWDTAFAASFKDCFARVYSQNIPFYYTENSFYMLYQTCVFFERKGVLFRIEARCKTKPQFLGPSSEWWRWLEAHWVWMDEPHPDWSRYPIHPSKIWYPGIED